MKNLFIAFIAVFCLSSCSINDDKGDGEDTSPLETGTPAPDFTIHPDGQETDFRLSDLRGKRVVLVFWASWCPDCRNETEVLKELYGTFASDRTVFIGISFDTDEEAWRKYIADNGMVWLQHREQKPWQESTLATAYNIKWIPTLYLIDEDGKVAFATADAAGMKAALSSPRGITALPVRRENRYSR